MIEYVLAVFSVRSDTMLFNAFLNRNGVKSVVVETPKSASASCGISVKFEKSDLSKVRILLSKSGTKSFVRFYLVSGFYGRSTIRPL